MSDKTFSIQALLNQRIPRKKLLLLDIRLEFFTKSSCLTNRLIFKTYRFGIAIYFLTWFISKRRYKSYDITKNYIVQLFFLKYPVRSHFLYWTTWAEILLVLYFIFAAFLSVTPHVAQDRKLVRYLERVTTCLMIVAFNFGIIATLIYWTLMRYGRSLKGLSL